MKFETVLSLLLVSELKAVLLNKEEGEKCKSDTTEKWTCELLSNCPQIGDFRSSRPDLCGFSGKDPVICCPPNDDGETSTSKNDNTTMVEKEGFTVLPTSEEAPDGTTNINNSNSESGSGLLPGFPPMAIMKCVEYEVKLCINEEVKPEPAKLYRREIPTSTLKQEFNLAPPNEFPFMALIGFGETSNISWECEGSIISETWILSAAHCVYSDSKAAKWVGLLMTKIDSVWSGFVTSIKKILIHPLYKEPAIYHDIALIQNEDEVIFNAFVRPMCISALKVLPRTATTTLRITESQGKKVSYFKKVDIKITTPEICEQLLQNRSLLPRGFDKDIMFCAGDSSQNSCEGGNEGSLFYKSSLCLHVQLGILSNGKKCGSNAGIYTKLSYYVPWIEKIVWANANIELPGGK